MSHDIFIELTVGFWRYIKCRSMNDNFNLDESYFRLPDAGAIGKVE